MKKPILIYGAGGLGREIVSLLMALDEWQPMGFVDDSIPVNQVVTNGLKVLGGAVFLQTYPGPIDVVIAIGDPLTKASIVHNLREAPVRYPIIIHPSAILQNRPAIHCGAGCVLAAGVILTTDIHLGDHVFLNLHVTVGHDTTLGTYSSVMPGVNIAGRVTLGEAVFVGAGANLRNNVRIGAESVVGMGAAVVHDVPERTTVVGVPAKPLQR
jgi:sugar O-acyltransferase (sialic acid O-acetyltransferase NeuD family)